MNIKDIKQGKTFYKVSALGICSYITTWRIANLRTEQGSVEIYHTSPIIGEHTVVRSLRDAGVIPNNYNNHKLFSSRRKAEAYLKLCKSGTVPRLLSQPCPWM